MGLDDMTIRRLISEENINLRAQLTAAEARVKELGIEVGHLQAEKVQHLYELISKTQRIRELERSNRGWMNAYKGECEKTGEALADNDRLREELERYTPKNVKPLLDKEEPCQR